MSDARISELPVGPLPLLETDEFVIRRGNSNFRVTFLQLQEAMSEKKEKKEEK